MAVLEGQAVLVAGGAGEVGEGIVRQLLHAGATVIVPSRSEDRLTALRHQLDGVEQARLHTLVGDLSTEAGAQALREKINREAGALDHVVASLGGWWQGKRLVDVELELWHRLIDDSLTAHFITAKTFLPVIAMRANSSYTLINGAGGLHAVPTAGPISVSAAGQMMLGRVLSAEHQQQPVRINTLVLATPVLTRSRPQGQPGWISADDAGKYCVYLAAEQGVDGETIIFDNADQVPQFSRS